MRRYLTIILTIVAVLAVAGNALAAKTTEDRVKTLEKKVLELQRETAQDRIKWSGDLRVEAHSVNLEIPDYVDGMRMQTLFYETMFAFAGSMDPRIDNIENWGTIDPVDPTTITPEGLDALAFQNYVAFQQFQALYGFEELKGWVQQMMGDPTFGPMMANMMQAYAMDAYREGFQADNDILYTTRLRLNMHSKLDDNISFTGRLSMYKPWGASTQTGVFNGQPNTLNTDANWPGTPGDATLKVDAAYFSWNNIQDTPFYLSLGRRPSTGGPPLHYRNDEKRSGTPMGTIIDFQFDGATLGYKLSDVTTLRACYGLGYESQYGNGLLSTENALKDAQFFGFNIDAYDTPEMQIQTTVARAFDLTDGFNGYMVMPNNPVTGLPMPGPIVTRFNPSVNLGDFDLASILLSRTDGPVDWFVTGSWSKSKPNENTGPFGGLLSDPFDMPEEQTGHMYYMGARFNHPNGKTKVGLEWNKGSQYWFNFTPAQDDLIGAKTATRGTVIEGYLTQRVGRKFVIKLGYIHYDYDYSGSGWHVGAPKDMDATPMLGFPTYKTASKMHVGFSARF